MNTSDRKLWIRASILIGVLYFLVGFAFVRFGAWAAANATREIWNRSAFLISGIAFALHIGYEHFRLRNSARLTAWHTCLAVALGAFLLALAANIHELGSLAGYRPRMLIALAVWPVITAVPAFIVAMILAAGLSLVRRRTT